MGEEYDEARERARQRYDFDFKGVVLNTAVSATSSVTAGSLLSFLDNVPSKQMPVIISVIFVAQVVPKLLVELNKSYRVNRARREGFSRGYVESDSIDDGGSGGASKMFFDFCRHASYY